MNTIRTWAASHSGHVRPHQEDAHTVLALAGGAVLLAVADGMGGHPAGGVAARAAIRGLSNYFAANYPGAVSPRAVLEAAVSQARRHVQAVGLVPGQRGAGCTLEAALVLPDGTMQLAHCGDSRIYLVSGSRIRQLTEDHENEVGQLTSCLGGYDLAKPPTVDFISGRLNVGDSLLLCSDGLFLHLADQQIRDTVQQYPDDPAQALVAAALGQGGLDNVTAVVATRLANSELPGPHDGKGEGSA